MTELKPKIIVILGPTASGKSDLAVKIAKKFNGEIISADSRQVYRGLDLGSGKITKKEMENIKHYLLDVASPKRTFTVEQYKKLAQKTIKKILKKHKVPIICGGTGLYIDSLIYDYNFPQVPPDAKLRKELEKFPTEELFEKLQKLDPRRAQNIDRHNRRRLIRALEIINATKHPIPSIDLFPGTILWDSTRYDILKIGISVTQEKLKQNITKRLYARLKAGMIEEVENLFKQGLSWKRLDDFGLEYRFISRYLRNLINKKEMEDLIIKESIKYAKRQMTWFKKDKNTYWINNSGQALPIIKDFINQKTAG